MINVPTGPGRIALSFPQQLRGNECLDTRGRVLCCGTEITKKAAPQEPTLDPWCCVSLDRPQRNTRCAETDTGCSGLGWDVVWALPPGKETVYYNLCVEILVNHLLLEVRASAIRLRTRLG